METKLKFFIVLILATQFSYGKLEEYFTNEKPKTKKEEHDKKMELNKKIKKHLYDLKKQALEINSAADDSDVYCVHKLTVDKNAPYLVKRKLTLVENGDSSKEESPKISESNNVGTLAGNKSRILYVIKPIMVKKTSRIKRMRII